MGKPTFERKKIFVNSLIQGQILWRAAAYWIIYHIVMWHTLFLFSYFQYRIELMNGGEAATFATLYGTFCLKYYPIVFSALGILPILMVDMIRYTHRIAGPLVAFQNALLKMRAGEKVEAVKLRTNDLLIEFQDEFNSFLDYYNQNLTTGDSEVDEDCGISEEQFLADVCELKKSVVSEFGETQIIEMGSSPFGRK